MAPLWFLVWRGESLELIPSKTQDNYLNQTKESCTICQNLILILLLLVLPNNGSYCTCRYG